MEKEILERYEKTADGNGIIIDIAVEKVEDLFEDYDKRSSYLKKDLDEDLVDYIIDSAKEVGKKPFKIRFNIENKPGPDSIERVQKGITNFFVYMKKIEREKMKEKISQSLVLLAIGLILATISVVVNKSDIVEVSVVGAVIAEGLTVAAWVSLWESLATFLIHWMPYRKKILLYEKIVKSNIFFV